MNKARSLLPQYFYILEENGIAQFNHCRHIPVSFDSSESTMGLWKKHEKALEKKRIQNVVPSPSLLDLKIELARRIYQACVFCERRCGIDRRTVAGNCQVQEARVASEFLHFGEESVLVPSYTVFFSGCTFHCVFCQNWDISQQVCGEAIPPDHLAQMIYQRKQQGARNMNWVGGDPTSNLYYIHQVLKNLDTNIPQVWNSNMFCSSETMRLLDGVIDVYLTDFKYGNDSCAQRLSKVDRYWEVVKRNHLLAYRQTEVIVRHLVMPNHSLCCSKPILEWIAKNLPDSLVNIMAQYRPEYQAEAYKDIAMRLPREEYQKVLSYAERLGLHII